MKVKKFSEHNKKETYEKLRNELERIRIYYPELKGDLCEYLGENPHAPVDLKLNDNVRDILRVAYRDQMGFVIDDDQISMRSPTDGMNKIKNNDEEIEWIVSYLILLTTVYRTSPTVRNYIFEKFVSKKEDLEKTLKDLCRERVSYLTPHDIDCLKLERFLTRNQSKSIRLGI